MSEPARPAPRTRVITVSDRCHAGEMRDTSGPAVAERLASALGARPAEVLIVPDERARIAAVLRKAVADGVELVVTTGGTGCAPKDVTPEATRSVIAREVPGLAEAMRHASAAITPHAYLARSVCGIAGATLIVNVPGSLKGAIENLEAILPLLPHALRLIGGDASHEASDAGRTKE